MDAARTCVRLGCEAVTVAYRRSQEQMPALLSEYEEARAEGVQFQWFASPVGVEGTDKVEGFKYEVMALNEDGAGIHGTGNFQVMPVDKIIIAAGHKPNARLVGEGNNLKVDEKGYIITSEDPYGMTSREGVFAGGDVVHKPATVVLAMREAKKAVECGYWGLYRYNPSLVGTKNPFSLDSKEPKADFREFLMGEVRYASLAKAFPEAAEALFEKTEKDAMERLANYKRLAEQQ